MTEKDHFRSLKQRFTRSLAGLDDRKFTRVYTRFPGLITQELHEVWTMPLMPPGVAVPSTYGEKPRNPVWSRDELILALNLFVRTKGNPTGQNFEAVDELSAILNKLHRITGNATSETLRNRNGVYLKVMNLRSSDPHYLDQGKVGMARGNKLKGVIWQESAGDPVRHATDARTIRATQRHRSAGI